MLKTIGNNILYLLFLILSATFVSAQELSEHAVVSLLTCAPGSEIYSVYGHNAIRVSDPVNKIDKVYNYGTFDFKESWFAMKFLRGET